MVLGLSLLVVPTLFAQGPIFAGATVFDSTGQKVGKFVDRPLPLLEYTIPGGDTVLLQATAGALITPPLAPLWFYTSSDCSGTDFYTPVGNGGSTTPLQFTPSGPFQLSKRQAAILNRAPSSYTAASSVLYATDPFPAPVFVSGFMASIFIAGQCRTTGLFDTSGIPLIHFQQVEDLGAKFTPPFWAN